MFDHSDSEHDEILFDDNMEITTQEGDNIKTVLGLKAEYLQPWTMDR